MLHYELLTPQGETLDRNDVLSGYPRPQLRRDSYLSLNGEWDYAIRSCEAPDGGKDDTDGKILVPYPPESALSGVRRTLRRGECLYYRRAFTVPQSFLRDVTLLHLDAVDQKAEVWVNDCFVGCSEGGYLPVTLDISSAVHAGENRLTVQVRDDLDRTLPTGKQRRRRGGIWYTPVSGLWQSVWLESVSRGYIRGLTVTPDAVTGRVTVEIDSAADCFDLTLSCAGETLLHLRDVTSSVRLEIPADRRRLWSPEDPFLYDLTVTSPGDRVESYFALRTFEAKDGRFYLNGKPYFVNGLLDQGYFSDGIYTPASYDVFREDIAAAKRLGFNTLRKHIKIEPMMFYHLCDTMGMLVFQDMVNVGRYSFFKDTVLPFSGLCKKRPYINVGKTVQENFRCHARNTVRYFYNVPSVVAYTIFNEGWGQFDGDGMYRILKETDPTRVYDATSGWFRETLSDVASEHIYFKPIVLKKEDKPIFVSEFGGYTLPLDGHRFNDKKTFGYKLFTDPAAFEKDFLRLYREEILGNLKNGLAGAVYTQLSDVEDECNGLLTYDRKVCKVDAARVKPLMDEICRIVAEGN